MAIVFVHEKIACVFLPSWSQRPGPVLHAGRDLWDNVGWGIFILRMHTLSPLSPHWYSSLSKHKKQAFDLYSLDHELTLWERRILKSSF